MLYKEAKSLTKTITNLKLSSDRRESLYDTYTIGQLAYACISKLLDMQYETANTDSFELMVELNRNIDALVKLLEEPQ